MARHAQAVRRAAKLVVFVPGTRTKRRASVRVQAMRDTHHDAALH